MLYHEERIWAGIDTVASVASMGASAYLTKLAKSGKSASTLLKGLATDGQHADDVNDVSKVVYAVATGKDPKSDLQNLLLGQAMGFGTSKVAGFIENPLGNRFYKRQSLNVDVDLPSGQNPRAIDLDLSTAKVLKAESADLHLSTKAGQTADLHLPSAKQVSKVADVDVPKVDPPSYNKEQILKKLEESWKAREASRFGEYVQKEKDLSEKIRYEKYWNEPILHLPKGERPDPKSYVNEEYLNKHLEEFKEGATVIQTEWAFRNYSETNGFVGVPDDNTLFVMPLKSADDVIQNSNGNLNYIEQSLGFPKDYFKYGGGLVRIDIYDFNNLNFRLPSGNEVGANSFWIPGGETSGRVPEAVLDTVPLDQTKIYRIRTKQ